MAVGEVLRFARDQGQSLIAPEVLGLPPVSDHATSGLTEGVERLVDALLTGDEHRARRVVIDLYLAKHPRSVIFDEVIAASFREIGQRWACHTAEVYQERRGCEIAMRILFDMRRFQSPTPGKWTATGGTIEGDLYALPSTMAELILRDAGFQATTLGTSIPFSSLIQAVHETRPKLFWLSVSHIAPDLDFLSAFAELSKACTLSGAALVVGGRALNMELRQRMTYSAFCDNMQHLEAFATTLQRSLAEGERKLAAPV